MDGSLREILAGKHLGKWRVQYIQVDDLGRKKRLSRLFGTKKEGRDFLQSLRHGAKVEITRQNELTLALWFDWLAEHDWPESLDEKTIAFRRGRFDKHVRKVLGHMPLKKVDPLAVRAFYRELRENGVGEATVHAIKANLVRAFNQALTPYGRVPITCANPFRLEIQAPALREAVALTPDEARAALACEALTPRERAMLATFLLAGLRLSELAEAAEAQGDGPLAALCLTTSLDVHREIGTRHAPRVAESLAALRERVGTSGVTNVVGEGWEVRARSALSRLEALSRSSRAG